jgi:hypothetical protein
MRVLTLIGKELLWKRKPAIKKVGRAAAHAQRTHARRYDAALFLRYLNVVLSKLG